MKFIFKAFLLSFITLLLSTAQASEVAGVNVEETTQAANTTLNLNGAGVRKKLFIKVYVAALYVTEKKKSADEILALTGPKKMNLTMLRDVTSETFANAFVEGMNKNTDEAERAKLATPIKQFGQLFSGVAEVKKGDVIALQWIPDAGTTVTLNGKKMGETFPDAAFFNALLRIWLGHDPVDSTLKNQLLGG